MLTRRFSIQYLSLVIVIFPFIVFLFCALNINIEYDQKVLDELSTSINDYPLSDLNFAPGCNDSQQSNVLYYIHGKEQLMVVIVQKLRVIIISNKINI